MENNKKPSLVEQQNYTLGEAEKILKVQFQPPLFESSEIARENIAVDKSHYARKFFDSFRDEFEFTSIGEDAKNMAEHLTVFQETIANHLSFIKNEHSKKANEKLQSLTIDYLRELAIEEHSKAFTVLQITPERYEKIALDEKEHWRRMAVAATHAFNREKAKRI